VCALAVAAVAFWPEPKEPEYNGKKLSEWLHDEPLFVPIQGRQRAWMKTQSAEAVRHIGTNALPFLLRWIRENQREPGTREEAFRLANRYRLWRFGGDMLLEAIDGRELRGGRALEGFRILGEEGGSAVPDLLQMATGSNEWTARAAIAGLGYAGLRALPPLMIMATNKSFRFHWEAMGAISQMSYLGTNARPAVEMLIRSLDDHKLGVGAADVLGRLGLEGDVCVPALERCLLSTKPALRMWGAISLGRFGAIAAPALPELVKALNDGQESVRIEVTNALMKIAPEVLEGVKQRQVQEGVGKSETNPSP